MKDYVGKVTPATPPPRPAGTPALPALGEWRGGRGRRTGIMRTGKASAETQAGLRAITVALGS